jgi:hypothetical protein
MSQTSRTTDVSSGVSRSSLWLAAVGFLLIAIGTGILSWFPTLRVLEVTVQALGVLLIALALVMNWRIHARRWGWAAFIFFLLGILAYGVMWSAYAVDPGSLGDPSATQRGFFTVGIGYLCAAIGMFLVIARKRRQPANSGASGQLSIAATVTQMLLFSVGALVCAAGAFIWLIPTDSKLQHFALLIVGWAVVFLSTIAARKGLAEKVGRPAAVMIILAVMLYWLHYVLDALPSWEDAEWRNSMHVSAIAFVFAAIAFILMATRGNKPSTSIVNNNSA